MTASTALKPLLRKWVVSALADTGGRATVLEVSKHVWQHHEQELRASGDGFYTWQYDIRWAAHDLRRRGILKPVKQSPRGIWELA